MGQYCFVRWPLLSVVCRRRLSSSAMLPAGGRTGRRARGRSGGRHCTAGQYGYVPLGRHLVSLAIHRHRHVLNGGQDRTNPFTAARDVKSAMRPFTKILWTLIISKRPILFLTLYSSSSSLIF